MSTAYGPQGGRRVWIPDDEGAAASSGPDERSPQERSGEGDAEPAGLTVELAARR